MTIATISETSALAFHSPVGLAGAARGAGQAAAGPVLAETQADGRLPAAEIAGLGDLLPLASSAGEDLAVFSPVDAAERAGQAAAGPGDVPVDLVGAWAFVREGESKSVGRKRKARFLEAVAERVTRDEAGRERLPSDVVVDRGPNAGKTVGELVQRERSIVLPDEMKQGTDVQRRREFLNRTIQDGYNRFCQERHLAKTSPKSVRAFNREQSAWLEELFQREGMRVGTGRGALIKKDKRIAKGKATDGRYRSGRHGIIATPEAWDLFKSLYLQANSLKLAKCWRYVRGEVASHGWSWPSLTWCRAKAKAKFPLGVRTYTRKGPRAAEAECVPKIERDYEEIAAGDWWVLDGRTLDSTIKVPDDRREWREARAVVTGVLDLRSRSLRLDVRATECSDGILSGIKQALLAWGSCTDALADNGEAYDGAIGSPRGSAWHRRYLDDPQIGSVFAQLGVQVHHSIPYHAWAKPIESIWNKLKEDFDRWLWHFRGGSPAERPEGRCAEIRRNIDDLPTEAELRDLLDIWLGEYHATEQSGRGTRGLCPNLVMERYRAELRPISPSFAEFLCRRTICRKGEPRRFKVHRDGVHWNHADYGAWDEAVWKLHGQQVLVKIDPDLADRVLLCDVAGRPLATAYNRQLAGTTQEHRREAHRKQDQARRIMREAAPARDYLRETPTRQVLLAKRRHAQAREKVARASLPALEPEQQPVVTLVRPDLAAAADQLAKREQARQAARQPAQALRDGTTGQSNAALTGFERLAEKARLEEELERNRPAESSLRHRWAARNREAEAG